MITLGKAVLIKPDIMPERTKTGRLIIPDTSKEMLPETGVVIQAGPACEQIREGERVKFPRKPSSVIIIDSVDHYFSYEHKIKYHE